MGQFGIVLFDKDKLVHAVYRYRMTVNKRQGYLTAHVRDIISTHPLR